MGWFGRLQWEVYDPAEPAWIDTLSKTGFFRDDALGVDFLWSGGRVVEWLDLDFRVAMTWVFP